MADDTTAVGTCIDGDCHTLYAHQEQQIWKILGILTPDYQDTDGLSA